MPLTLELCAVCGGTGLQRMRAWTSNGTGDEPTLAYEFDTPCHCVNGKVLGWSEDGSLKEANPDG